MVWDEGAKIIVHYFHFLLAFAFLLGVVFGRLWGEVRSRARKRWGLVGGPTSTSWRGRLSRLFWRL